MKTSKLAKIALIATAGAAFAIFIGLELYKPMGISERVGRAKMDVKILEVAAMAYKSRHGEWPSNLEVMTERQVDGTPAMLKDPSILIDPWGEPYRYDPKQLHPTTGKPLIWSGGGKPGSKFANWD